MQALVLTAGKGKRLQPFTFTRTKCMAPILDKPMVALVVDSLIDAGINDFVFVVSIDDNEIRKYFETIYKSDHYNVPLKFSFVIQPDRLGMAHAVNCAKDLIKENFIVSAADSLVSSSTVNSLINTFIESNAVMVLTLLPVMPEKISKSGIVALDSAGKIIKIVEKPKPEEAPSNIGSIPLYAFKPNIFSYLENVQISPRGEYELQDAIQMIIETYGSIPGVMADYRLDLTSMDDLLNINLMFLEKLKNSIFMSKVPSDCKIIDPVFISKNVNIAENCEIGPNVYLESGCIIERNVAVKNSIVLRDGVAKEYTRIENQVILRKDVD